MNTTKNRAKNLRQKEKVLKPENKDVFSLGIGNTEELK